MGPLIRCCWLRRKEKAGRRFGRCGNECEARKGDLFRLGQRQGLRFFRARHSDGLLQGIEILLTEVAIAADFHAAKGEGAEACAGEALHFEAELPEHDTDLSLESLMQDHLDLIRSKLADRFDACHRTFDPCTFFQCRGITLMKGFVEDDLIFLLHSLGGVHQFLGKCAIIGEQEKSFTLLVQTAHMKEMPGIGREEFENRPFGVTVAAGCHITRGFVEQEGAWRDGMDNPPADTDIIALMDTSRKFAGHRAVDGDAASEDVLLAGTTRSQAGRRQKTIQAQTRLFGRAPVDGGVLR